MEELKKYFPNYFQGKTKKNCPSRNECLSAIKSSRENNGAICLRHWETIKKKVYNYVIKH